MLYGYKRKRERFTVQDKINILNLQPSAEDEARQYLNRERLLPRIDEREDS